MYDFEKGRVPVRETGTIDRIVSAEMVRFIPTFVLLAAIFILGAVGNGLVFYIYKTRYQTSNTRMFILFLSSVDFFACIIAVPVHTLTIPDQYRLYTPVLCKGSGFLDSIGTVGTSLILISIAFERYRKVCRPLSRQMNIITVTRLCVLSISFGVITAVPNALIYGRKTINLANYSIPLVECSIADDYESHWLPHLASFFYCLLFLVVIFLFAVLYSFAIGAIYKQANKMGSYTVSSGIRRMFAEQTEVGSLETKSNTEDRTNSTITRNWSLHSVGDIKGSYLLKVKFDKKLSGNNSTEKKRLVEKQNTARFVVSDPGDAGMESSNHHYHESKDASKARSEHNRDIPKSESDIVTTDLPSCSTSTLDRREGTRTARGLVSVLFPSTTTVNSMTGRNKVQRNASPTPSQASNTLHNAYRRSIFMMLAVSLTFIVSYIPVIALLIIVNFDPDFIHNLTNTQYILYKMSLRSYFLNFAANPIIYGICDSKFRQILKQLFSNCFAKCREED